MVRGVTSTTNLTREEASMDRRTFLRRTVVGGAAAMGPFHALGVRTVVGQPPSKGVGYGPLVLKGDLWLPADFNYQVVSRQGVPMSDGNLTPGIFDGMAAFPGRHRGSTILIRNHENRRRAGEIPVIVPADKLYDPDPTYNAGDTKLVVRRRRTGARDPMSGQPLHAYEILEDFAILGGTDTNCAGGIAGDSWITCEEVVNRSAAGFKHGYSFEIPAYAEGPVKAVPIVGMGRFAHEANAELDGVIYETEDRSIVPDPLAPDPLSKKLLGSCLYRYVIDGWHGGDGRHLARTRGKLQALKLRDEFHANMDIGRVVGTPYRVEWVMIAEPDHEDDTDDRRDRVPGFTPTRVQAQDRGAAFFDRLEGIWTDTRREVVYFDCTAGGMGPGAGFGQVWEYDPRRRTVTLIFESPSGAVLEAPDNIVVVPKTGDIFLQEDGGDEQFVRGITRDGEIYDFARTALNETEFCGGCFDPDGHTLYLSQQGDRGALPAGPLNGGAVLYAIYGPFERREGHHGGRGRGHDDDD
jgi:uncharacterized protein